MVFPCFSLWDKVHLSPDEQDRRTDDEKDKRGNRGNRNANNFRGFDVWRCETVYSRDADPPHEPPGHPGREGLDF